MAISINNPAGATWIFIAIFLIAVLVSARPKKSAGIFPKSLTAELKGLAILAIIFSHFGYFLATDHDFLFPLSILAGVGVNLFLFLSGLGLTRSALKAESRLTIWRFYRQRLPKLFLPLWIILAAYLFLDFFVLKITYSWPYILKVALGFFPRADVFLDLNSPLWYFTLILFYYLIFPWIFSKKRPWLSVIIIYAATYFILNQNLVWLYDVKHLYELHLIAFPLGIFAGWLMSSASPASSADRQLESWRTSFLKKFSTIKPGKKSGAAYYVLLFTMLALIGYLAYYSGVGQSPDTEQAISIATMLAIIILFSYKRTEFKLFSLFGLYSYEIYLLHWPLASRYDLFYKNFPAWLATIFYLLAFLALAWALKKISNWLKFLV